jgi:hypothetical protein
MITKESLENKISKYKVVENDLRDSIERLSTQLSESQSNLLGIRHRIAELQLLLEEFTEVLDTT